MVPPHVTCLAHARLVAARAAFASVATRQSAARLGTITLRMDQRQIVARAEAALVRDGGCIIADEVGRGKSYVALAIAQRWRAPLVIAPASLRDGWELAMQRSGVSCSFVSHEMLSRGWAPALDHDGIVVDESHHFRNPATRRHATLARIGAFTPLVLLSATPIQNSARDLVAQLSLYLGASANELTLEQLGSRVLRGVPLTDDTLPVVAPPRWLRPDIDDGVVLQALLALPPPPRVAGGGEAGALREISIVRAWASSRAALRRLVLRRQRAAVAIEQCLESHRLPSRAELLSWTEGDDAVQLGFAVLLAEQPVSDGDRHPTLKHVANERDSLTRLQRLLASTDDPDHARASALRSVREQFAGAGVIAFAESASTAREYYLRLSATGGVGLLTARGARIASGALSRRELLARFAPVAQGSVPVASHERVTLLITTDILAEGVNLQDASVVVHLDLPWNPARLAQRLGRVRRPGGGQLVHSFLMAPPAQAARLLETEQRMRRKIAIARVAVGKELDVLPVLVSALAADDTSKIMTDIVGTPAISAEGFGAIEAVIAEWHRPRRPRPSRAPPVVYVAAARSPRRGWVAALSDGRRLASLEDHIPDTDRTLLPALTLAAGPAVRCHRREWQHATDAIERWLAAEQLAQLCGVTALNDPLRRALANHSATELRQMPRHLRDAAFVMAQALRAVLSSPLSLGAERLLSATLASARSDDPLAWLTAASGIAERYSARRLQHASDSPTPHLVALIMLGNFESDANLSERLLERR